MQAVRRHPRRGSAIVEFALIGLAFLAIAVGIFEFGRAVWVYNTLSFAAAQGVRFAMVRGESNPATEEEVHEVVAAHAVGVNAATLDVTTTWDPDNQRGSFVEVEAAYPFRFVAPLLVSNSSLTLRGRARAPIVR